jgi:hypothetical protein
MQEDIQRMERPGGRPPQDRDAEKQVPKGITDVARLLSVPLSLCLTPHSYTLSVSLYLASLFLALSISLSLSSLYALLKLATVPAASRAAARYRGAASRAIHAHLRG